MFEQAKARIRGEMDQNPNNPYIQVIGAYLLNYIEANHSAAERLLAADKTIAKSLDAMKKEAEKKKVGNCAVLSDSEGYAIVLKYFGIQSVPNAPAALPQKTQDDFDIKLEDLLV